MHLCAQEDRVSVAEELVKENAAIDPKTKAGYTPLHVACHFGSIFLMDSALIHTCYKHYNVENFFRTNKHGPFFD